MHKLAISISHYLRSGVTAIVRIMARVMAKKHRDQPWSKGLTGSGIRAVGLGLFTLGLTIAVTLIGQVSNSSSAVAVPGADGSSKISQTTPQPIAPISAIPQATLRPASPQLGDTLYVLVNGSNSATPNGSDPVAPQIALGKKVYPAFPLQTSSNNIRNSVTNNATTNTWRALIPTTPLDPPGAKQLIINHGNAPSQTLNFTLRNREFPTQSLWIDESGNALEPTDTEWEQVSAFKKIVTPKKMWQGKFLRPNEGEVTTGFGVRRYYNGVFAEDYYHRGVDYGGGYGSPVIAPAGGVVRLVGDVNQGFRLHGNTVGIDHGQGVLSIFLHLSKITVQPGDTVIAGQMIGEVGSTGASTGAHLHWGLYVQGESVDPAPWRYGDID
jgi:murein DD-endopeptidase MepM/ murein hydrolase activator NlpD